MLRNFNADLVTMGAIKVNWELLDLLAGPKK